MNDIVQYACLSLDDAAELTRVIEECGGREISLTYARSGQKKTVKLTPTYSESEGKYKTGIWVKDSGAGIGTVTYVVPRTGEFGGLGHGICDGETGELVLMERGIIAEDDALHYPTMYALVNKDIDELYFAADLFEQKLMASYDGSTKEITKVNGEKKTVESYYVNVTKQTLEKNRDGSGGYDIADLSNEELFFFIAEALKDTAQAYKSYESPLEYLAQGG